ncbi:hypothetical protein EMCRGX_G021660 [Ephydatia muelleri]
MDKMKWKESSVPIMSADVFELLIVKKKVSLVISLPFYIQLSAHLQSPQEDISTELFTKVLSCSASELSERLSLNQPAKRSGDPTNGCTIAVGLVSCPDPFIAAAGGLHHRYACKRSGDVIHPQLRCIGSGHETTVGSPDYYCRCLENMLGSTPERGHAITAAHNGQFVMLEMHWRKVP